MAETSCGLPSRKDPSANPSLESIPWSEVVGECYDKQLSFVYAIAKVIYADDRTERAVILRKPDGLYTAVREKLYPFGDDEFKYGISDLHGYWQPCHDTSSIFDTEERAVLAVMADPPFQYNKRS